jgi:hypothetical protein
MQSLTSLDFTMTQAEIAFFRRRQREELLKAEIVADVKQKQVHLQWARYFGARLDGLRLNKPAVPPAGPVSLRDLAA